MCWPGAERLNFALLSLIARAGPEPLGSSPCPHPSGKRSAMPSGNPALVPPSRFFLGEVVRVQLRDDDEKVVPEQPLGEGPLPLQ